MRVLTWSLGILVLAAWHNVAQLTAHTVPWVWTVWLISWFLLGAGVLAGTLVSWLARKAKAGGMVGPQATAGHPPARVRDKDVQQG
jgi:DMSO reductase anchor subunit